ncbi:ubiquitin protein ligase E3A [Capsaspora owczarzaki ATCC 30864]|uniref:HECT-type E3 ubiquitin transferase n=1 Tax=Capsaspora owczarzaki (strain ATCC 30864) TaxID=595528 RepID=A0A0D2U1U3_CAPO3|nr:ubiquitin protein ligase E3A [Capsaspora owczarzaki ATCC 30864]KJE89146.1 ubiquitin protein ligase E3A [Capsaspora owczarzaki ATCC 30864]|eukprot:XP_004365547.1 ubiquitin protein ligase E3A [Capsaspora owczarzaki ATCC 30864]
MSAARLRDEDLGAALSHELPSPLHQSDIHASTADDDDDAMQDSREPGLESRLSESFKLLARLLYRQLSLGCGSGACRNPYCASAFEGRHRYPLDVASLMTLELASTMATTHGPNMLLHASPILCLLRSATMTSDAEAVALTTRHLADDVALPEVPRDHVGLASLPEGTSRSGVFNRPQTQRNRKEKPRSGPDTLLGTLFTATSAFRFLFGSTMHSVVPPASPPNTATSNHATDSIAHSSVVRGLRDTQPISSSSRPISSSSGNHTPSRSALGEPVPATDASDSDRLESLSSMEKLVFLASAVTACSDNPPLTHARPRDPLESWKNLSAFIQDKSWKAALSYWFDSLSHVNLLERPANNPTRSRDVRLQSAAISIIQSLLSSPEAFLSVIPLPHEIGRPLILNPIIDLYNALIQKPSSHPLRFQFCTSLASMLAKLEETHAGDNMALNSLFGSEALRKLREAFEHANESDMTGYDLDVFIHQDFAPFVPSPINLPLAWVSGLGAQRTPILVALFLLCGFFDADEAGSDAFMRLFCRLCATLSLERREFVVDWLSRLDLISHTAYLNPLGRHLSRLLVARAPFSAVRQLNHPVFETAATIQIVYDALEKRARNNVMLSQSPPPDTLDNQGGRPPAAAAAFVLYQGNENWRTEQKTFANIAVEVMVDIRRQLLRWPVSATSFSRLPRYFQSALRVMQATRSPGDSTDALLNYPCLLSTVSKVRLLHFWSATHMSAAFHSAFFNSAWLANLQKHVSESLRRKLVGAVGACNGNTCLLMEVRREFLVPDALRQLKARVHDLQKPLKVRFVKSGEDGVDLGGVQKDFLQALIGQLASPEFGLFVTSPETRQLLIRPESIDNFSSHSDVEAVERARSFFIASSSDKPSESAAEPGRSAAPSDSPVFAGGGNADATAAAAASPSPAHSAASSSVASISYSTFSEDAKLKLYTLFGVALGLALYNGIVVNAPMPIWLFGRILEEARIDEVPDQHRIELFMSDIKISHPALIQGLQQLLEFDGDVENVFCRTFEVSATDPHGRGVTHELKPGGSAIPVTKDNRKEFVALYVHYVMVSSINRQLQAIAHGFWLVCDTRALNLFTASELSSVLCGSDLEGLDFRVLARAAAYDGMRPDQPLAIAFWDVVLNDFSDEERRALLQFVTGSNRIPLQGLAAVTFVLQRNGSDSDRLPSAMTCFGRLLLPEYSSKAKLAEKLRIALSAQGFGLV